MRSAATTSLNEPVNTADKAHGPGQVGAPYLANTYASIVQAMRLVDTNHILWCEGDAYASTLSDMENPPWSDPASNLGFSDHDYGSALPLGTANRSTCIGLNIPIWCGEFGLNGTRWNNHIVTGTYEAPFTKSGRTIVEGYTYWAYKAALWDVMVQNPQPPGWKALKAYWASHNSVALRPSVTNAYQWLMSYAIASNFTNCVVRTELADCLIRTNVNAAHTGFAQAGLPYVPGAAIPGKIFAVDYDLGDSNVTYVDTLSDDEANSGPNGVDWNSGNFGRDDGVDTTASTDPGTLLKVGWNDAGEWQRHTITCTAGGYDLYIRYAGGATGGQVDFLINGNDISGTVDLPNTGGYTTYATRVVTNVVVVASGKATLQITCVSPGYDLLWVEFVPSGGPPATPVGEFIPGAQPGVPAGLSAGVAAVVGNAQVSLHWVAGSGATGFVIKRATDPGGPFLTIGRPGGLAFVDPALTNGVTYYYTVSGVNGNGEGNPSASVSATPHANSLPAPLMDSDVGVSTLWSGDAGDLGWPGSASVALGLYTVVGSGIDIGGNADSCHYLFRSQSSDCTNIVQVKTLQGNSIGGAKAGLMIRESLNQDSPNAFIGVTAQNGTAFSYRNVAGATTTTATGSGSVPLWLKLVRNGNVLIGSTSANGVTWTTVGTATVPMNPDVLAGLAVTAQNNTQTSAATFAAFSLSARTLAAPVNLSLTASSQAIALSWTAVANADSYNILRGTSAGGPFTPLATSILETNYSDTAIFNGTVYYYVVTAANWNESGPASNEVTGSAPLPSLSANFSGSELTISWPASATPLSLYRTTNLTPPVVWSPVAVSTVTQSNLVTAVVSATNANEFFRLSTP